MPERIETIEDAIAFCEANPILSQDHHFAGSEENEYLTLSAKGRTLYDNLRTQFGIGHGTAITYANLTHPRSTS